MSENIPNKINLNKYRLGKTFRRLPYHFRSYKGRTIGLDREAYGWHYCAGEFKYNGWKEPFHSSHSAKQISNQCRRSWEKRLFARMLKEIEQDKQKEKEEENYG